MCLINGSIPVAWLAEPGNSIASVDCFDQRFWSDRSGQPKVSPTTFALSMDLAVLDEWDLGFLGPIKRLFPGNVAKPPRNR